jgi:glycosyltransferase involved in cell wall biosynthesis
MRWHLLTGEYPPASGGVGAYTSLLAQALAEAGDNVDVWVGGPVQPAIAIRRRVHALPDAFGPQSRAVLEEAFTESPGIVLLQYVPNALGRRGTNVAFCRWLLDQRRAGRDIRVMFHEPYFYFTLRRPWRNVVAVLQRVMAALLARAATQLYYSSENWHAYLSPYGADSGAIVLPVPATIPADPSPAAVGEVRRKFAPGARVVGHFGTFGAHVAAELGRIVPALLARDGNLRVILIGRDGERFLRDLVRRTPAAAERVHATGELRPADVAIAIAACDVLCQPYPDGVTTRRTSVMAGLHNGIAIVSTAGPLTEPVWRETGAVVLAPQGDVDAAVTQIRRLLDDRAARRTQAERGRDAYERHFAMELTVARLRAPATSPVPA